MFKVFFVIVLVGFVFPIKNKDSYLTWCILALFVTIALRHEVCFIDTVRYVDKYRDIYTSSIHSILNNYEKDPGFFVFSKVVSLIFGPNYTIWLAIQALMYIIPLYLLIRKYSNNYTISLVTFCALGFGLFSMTGLRQTDSMGLTMLALYFLLDHKKGLFFLFCTCAVLFHKTALIFYICFFFDFLPLNKRTVFIYLGLGIAIVLLTRSILSQLSVFVSDERFAWYLENQRGVSIAGLVQQLMLLTASILLIGNRSYDRVNKILILMSIAGITLQGMSFAVAEMFRMSMYFSIANVLLFANSLEMYSQRVQSRTVLRLAVIVVSLYFMTSNNNGFLRDYYFFFQNPPVSVYNELVI